jgi:hypothetical protein
MSFYQLAAERASLSAAGLATVWLPLVSSAWPRLRAQKFAERFD